MHGLVEMAKKGKLDFSSTAGSPVLKQLSDLIQQHEKQFRD